MYIDCKVVLQILRRSPQGFTPFNILDRLLAQPQYQGHSRSSIFAELLPVLQSLRDSQVIAHVSPRWVLVEPIESTSVELGDGKDADSSEENDESEALIIQHESEENLNNGFTNKVGKAVEFTIDSKQENTSYMVKAAIDSPIEILIPNLSMRAYNGLKRAGINTIDVLLQTWSDGNLLSIKNF